MSECIFKRILQLKRSRFADYPPENPLITAGKVLAIIGAFAALCALGGLVPAVGFPLAFVALMYLSYLHGCFLDSPLLTSEERTSIGRRYRIGGLVRSAVSLATVLTLSWTFIERVHLSPQFWLGFVEIIGVAVAAVCLLEYLPFLVGRLMSRRHTTSIAHTGDLQ